MLPPGPKWQAKPWDAGRPTKSEITLYYRDPIECIASLFNSPLLADQLDLVPYRLYQTAEKTMRIYDEWMSGDNAWDMQVSGYLADLPPDSHNLY
jgi:hypothetical protein